jgi:cysteinyl-tRNA synthetase
LFETSESDNISIAEEKLPANQVFSELANDLHSPKALARLFEFINDFPANKLSDESKKIVLNNFEKINYIFAVWEISPKIVEEYVIPTEIIELAEKRKEAKANKDYTAADTLRKQITELGFTIVDKKDTFEIIPIK